MLCYAMLYYAILCYTILGRAHESPGPRGGDGARRGAEAMIYVNSCIYIYMYIYIYIYIYTCDTYIYIYMFTYISNANNNNNDKHDKAIGKGSHRRCSCLHARPALHRRAAG